MISSQDTSDRVLEPQSKLAPRRIGVTRNAFTLIEVTLALGLVTMLMAALYASMDVYFSTATESYGEIERAQIARALLRDLARDIQSSTFTKQESMDSSDEDEDADTDVVDADEALELHERFIRFRPRPRALRQPSGSWSGLPECSGTATSDRQEQ